MPKDTLEVPAWNLLERYFFTHHHGKDTWELVQAAGGGKYGIIIAGWNEAEVLTSFLEERVISFCAFSESVEQHPKMYQTLRQAIRSLNRIRSHEEPWEGGPTPPYVGFCAWVTPGFSDSLSPLFQNLLEMFPQACRKEG